ncbi:MAG: NAD(P)H-hydrate dehydratase [Gammaproteobacteria bacterium]|nr:NAD(P)H-hydrate dehydratase [Gammaproteobacteria bacterium]
MQQTHPPIYFREQIKTLETMAMQEMEVSAYELMQRAANAAFHWIAQRKNDKTRCLVLVGKGNNGGDGLVFARRWREVGRDVTVVVTEKDIEWTGAALQAYQAFIGSGGEVHELMPHQIELENYDLIVDAMLGTGIERAVSGTLAAWIDFINHSDVIVLALDTPSGIHPDTGEILGYAVNADFTVSFIANKTGFFLNDGPNCVGRLSCDDLGIPQRLFEAISAPVMRQENGEEQTHYLHSRKRTFHKGDAGYVLVVGGNSGFSGATVLAGLAALRTGAGLVSVAAHPESVTAIRSAQAELMVHPIHHASEIEPLFERAAVIIVGPGLGQDTWAQEVLSTVLQANKPLVVDADALNLLAKEPHHSQQWVLTPHPGEAARMLNKSTQNIQQDRLHSAHTLQEKYGGVVVLKGANSLITTANDVPTVCAEGNPGMATAGMGDVLSGVIGSLIAQGIPQLEATKLGVWLHASAGDLAAQDGERGMIASDLLMHLRTLVNSG